MEKLIPDYIILIHFVESLLSIEKAKREEKMILAFIIQDILGKKEKTLKKEYGLVAKLIQGMYKVA